MSTNFHLTVFPLCRAGLLKPGTIDVRGQIVLAEGCPVYCRMDGSNSGPYILDVVVCSVLLMTTRNVSILSNVLRG